MQFGFTYHATDNHSFIVRKLAQFLYRTSATAVHSFLCTDERMVSDVHAQDLFFGGKLVLIADRWHVGQLFLCLFDCRIVKQRALADILVFLSFLAGCGGYLMGRQQRIAVTKFVEGTCLNQQLESGFAHLAGRKTPTEIIQTAIWAAILAFSDDCFCRAFAEVANGSQAEYNSAICDRECRLREVYRRGADGQAHPAALHDILGNVIYAVHHRAQMRSHELCRIVGLQVGRPVCH